MNRSYLKSRSYLISLCMGGLILRLGEIVMAVQTTALNREDSIAA